MQRHYKSPLEQLLDDVDFWVKIMPSIQNRFLSHHVNMPLGVRKMREAAARLELSLEVIRPIARMYISPRVVRVRDGITFTRTISATDIVIDNPAKQFYQLIVDAESMEALNESVTLFYAEHSVVDNLQKSECPIR